MPDLTGALIFADPTNADGFASVDLPLPSGLAGGKIWRQRGVLPTGPSCTTLGLGLLEAVEVTIE